METLNNNDARLVYTENKDGVLEATVPFNCNVIFPGPKKTSVKKGDKLLVDSHGNFELKRKKPNVKS